MIILAVLLLAFIAIQTAFVQNWLVGLATQRLSRALGTEVSVTNVSFSLFNRLNMEGTLVRDQQKDTLLYAGKLKVRITDWFFLKEKAVLKYAGLEDAVIKLQRKDSVWNHAFILDYFSSPQPKKQSGGLELNLKTIELRNVRILKNDLWIGERMDIAMSNLLLDAENVDFKKSIFHINSVQLERPFVRILSLDGLRPDSLRPKPTKDTGMYLNAGDIALYVNRVTIKNGSLFIDGNTGKPIPHFDGSHIQLSKLTGTLNQIRFVKDTLRADINLSVKDRCGLELRKLKTAFRFTPQIMELAKLDLQTNKSRLTNYYAMQFRDFNKDFAHYISQVVMQANFTSARVHTDDIAFFAPELKDWKKEVLLSGKYLGTVEDFTVNDLSAKIGGTTWVIGSSFSMKGLPDINTTRIELKNGTLQTNYADMGSLIPRLRGVTSPNLAALGNIIYRGNFDGTVQNFVTAGTFSTQLGGVRTNISLKLPGRGEPSYTGALETTRFNIGKFLSDSSLGLVDFKGRIVGSSFNIDKLKTTVQGTATSLEYKGYTYTNIISLGTFQRKYFNGEIKIDDPNLDFTSTVEIDLSKDLPRYNIVGDLVNSNLKALKLTKDSILVTGLLDVNFTGTNIDNFLGSAKFLNANIKSERNELNFDSLNLSSTYVDSVKYLHLGSNEFNATIHGRFSIRDLPASFQAFLTRYYPTYIKQPKSVPQNQVFSFRINTGHFEPYLQLLDKRLYGFNDASISGSVDTRRNQLAVEAAIPAGRYDKISFTGLDLGGKGNKDSISVTGNITEVQVSDSLRFPNSKIRITSNNDHSIVSIKTSADNTLNDADLQADVYTLTDGARIQFRPSSFVLNDKKWSIEKAGELTVRSKLVQAEHVKFTQGFQEISIESEHPDDGSSSNNLAIRLKNVVLGDLTSIFFKDPRLEGVTSGTVHLNDLMGSFNAAADLKAEQFRLNDDSVGQVNILASYDARTGRLPFSVRSNNEGYQFSAKGSYDLKDSTGRSFTTDIALQNSKIDFLRMFLSDLFSDIKGQASGNLTIKGDLNAPDLLGRIQLKNAGMKVNYTQVYYTIDSADIRFTEEGIDFGRFNIHDRYQNTGTVSGKLKERGFKNIVFDLDMFTNKLLLIDTRPQDNQQFYGKAIGSARLRMTGPEYAAQMQLIAESNDSSHIFIPNSVSKESGVADFIVFKQYGTEMENAGNKSNFNLSVDLVLTANNNVMIDVILDELAGDVIKAVGYGNLRIKAGTTEPLTMWGRYNIDKGSYVFNLQNILRKPFELAPDAGNYIEWNGDPFKAEMHVDARYTAERISLAELVSNLNLSPAVKGYRGDVYVIAQLRDKLSRPDIRFRIDFPQGSPVKSDNEFNQYLNRLERDQNEILNQVAFLFLFNSFQPPGGLGSANALTPYSITSLTVNTISQLLTKSVNKVLSNLLFRITGDKSLRFDVGTSVYSSSNLIDPGSSSVSGTNSKLDRTRVDLKFGYAFANEKIIVTLGSDIDFNFGNSSAIQNGNTQWLPNVNIEFILSKDKKLRLIVFNKASLDLSGASFGRRNRQGVSISYRKDFETLFANKEKDLVIKTPVDSTANKQQ